MYVHERCEYNPSRVLPSANYFTFVCRLILSLSCPTEACRDPYLMISFRSKSETTESGESVHEEAESTI